MSAYPDKIRKLTDLVNGDWQYVRPGSDISIDASYGFYRVLMQYDGFSPYKLPDGRTIYPKTDNLYENYITKPEVEFLRERGFECNVIDGFEFIPNAEPVFPFKQLIERLYALKESTDEKENPSLYLFAKYRDECRLWQVSANSRRKTRHSL